MTRWEVIQSTNRRALGRPTWMRRRTTGSGASADVWGRRDLCSYVGPH